MAPVHAEGSSGNTAPVPFHVTVPTRPMALKQVLAQMPPDAQVGAYGTGPLCLSRVPVTVDHMFEKSPTRSYARAFATEAGIAGYAVAGPSMFGREARIRPEVEAGAAITALSVGGCTHNRRRDIFSAGSVVTVTATLDWQVFDARRQVVLFHQSTQGHGDGTGGNVNGTSEHLQQLVIVGIPHISILRANKSDNVYRATS